MFLKFSGILVLQDWDAAIVVTLKDKKNSVPKNNYTNLYILQSGHCVPADDGSADQLPSSLHT